MAEFDVAVIGAGPAGMAAARTCASFGAKTVLLDEQPSVGGQIYRHVLEASAQRRALLGEDYSAGIELAKAIDIDGLTHQAGAVVWRIDDDGRIVWSKDNQAADLKARHVILATGALERPYPMPGWTLAGVMTAGAAQIFLKSSGMVVENAVLAGCGPLLYLVASQLIKAGSAPLALVETQTPADHLRAAAHLPMALRNIEALKKGVKMLADIKAAGVPRYTAASALQIEGTDHVSAISFSSKGKRHHIECEILLLHCGVIPNTHISRALRLEHTYDQPQRAFRPVLDEWCVTSNAMFSVAGDGGGIGGANAAALKGEIAALGALSSVQILSSGECAALVKPMHAALRGELAIRPFLDALYPPPVSALLPDDDVIVCRCEEVTAGALREFAKLGCTGPNQAKAFGRSGMGPCQGRYCGPAVTEILAAENGNSQQQTGAYRVRAPLKPVCLEELASLANRDN